MYLFWISYMWWMSWAPVGMTWRNHVPPGFRHSELNLFFPGVVKNSSPGTRAGMSKEGILSDPIQVQKDLNSWSSRVESKRGRCQSHTVVTGTRDDKKFMWTCQSWKTSMNLSGTSGFLPFESFLSWLNEHRISSLVQKDQYNRLEVCRPHIRSWSERGFTNVAGIPRELSGYQKNGSIYTNSI